MAKVKRNSKAFEKLNLAIEQLDGLRGRVGWFESSKYPDGTPVAYVAAIQELGSGAIPPRPFFRTAINDDAQRWANVAALGAKNVLAAKETGADAMERVAITAAMDVSKVISLITEPPLSPITIQLRAMKKRDPGLIVTGATVGKAAARVKRPGYEQPEGVSTKPLVDTGYMLATLTAQTEKESGGVISSLKIQDVKA